jgi:hypothetical protein
MVLASRSLPSRLRLSAGGVVRCAHGELELVRLVEPGDADHAHEVQPEHDEHDARDLLERGQGVSHDVSDSADRSAEDDEYGREAQDEGDGVSHRNASLRRKVIDLARDAREVPEVGRHERQAAGRENATIPARKAAANPAGPVTSRPEIDSSAPVTVPAAPVKYVLKMVNSSRKIRMPTTMTSAPPSTSSTGMIGRILRMPRIAVPIASPARMNGRPSPADQKASRKAPCATVADEAAMVRIAPRIGPMHGVQPTAKADPMPKDRP